MRTDTAEADGVYSFLMGTLPVRECQEAFGLIGAKWWGWISDTAGNLCSSPINMQDGATSAWAGAMKG